ncbi:MAG TPA: ABC transporter ATP-binding protein [Baekduia sp.]|nr:ABC transporter ATP-binding protein [Baekduia sp.]
MSVNAPLLRVSDLSVEYTRGDTTVRAVDGVDLEVPKGATLGLVGESGCGKSTVAKAVVRLLRPTRGSIEFDGQDLATLSESQLRPHRPRLQMIFQDPQSSLDPRMTVREIVEEPLAIHRRGNRAQRSERVRDLMDRVGLPRRMERRYGFQLSGGQQQRVAIARALALSPDLVVADEPTSALDVSIQAQILTLLADLQRDLGLSYLFISHDLGAVRQLAHEVAVMYLGRVCESGPVRDVLDHPRHPYTAALLSAAPVPDPDTEAARERIVLRGDVPSPANPPSGCRFHTRCWLRAELRGPELCATTDPAAGERPGGGRVHCHFAAQLHDHVPGARSHAHAVQGGDT